MSPDGRFVAFVSDATSGGQQIFVRDRVAGKTERVTAGNGRSDFPAISAGGHYVAGMNVILQGRLLPAADMAEQFFRPLHEASLELGSLLVG